MEDQKRRQIEYHEAEHYCARQPRQADNSNPLIAWLNSYRLRKMVEMIGTPPAGKAVLSLCGGDGEEADFLRQQGAKVTMIDLSAAAVEAARARNPALHCLCMNAEERLVDNPSRGERCAYDNDRTAVGFIGVLNSLFIL